MNVYFVMKTNTNIYSSTKIFEYSNICAHPWCTVYSVQCTVYSFQCIVYSEQSTMYSVHYTVYSVQCIVYSVQCTLYSVQCTVSHVQFTVYIVHCTVYTVQCTMYSVQCAVYSVQCTVYSLQCNVYSVQHIVYSKRCTVYSQLSLCCRPSQGDTALYRCSSARRPKEIHVSNFGCFRGFRNYYLSKVLYHFLVLHIFIFLCFSLDEIFLFCQLLLATKFHPNLVDLTRK